MMTSVRISARVRTFGAVCWYGGILISQHFVTRHSTSKINVG